MRRESKNKRPQSRMSCCSRPTGPDDPDTLEAIVRDYVLEHRPRVEQEMRWWASQPSLKKAVEMAALSKLESRKRHSHQCRIPAAVLGKAKDRLLEANHRLRGRRTFHDLLETVQREIGGIRGVGELLIYDVAHRIGAHLKLEPERIYLHAGARAGAKALGLCRSRGQKYLEWNELPKPLRRLRPAEVEHCLCIYRRILGKVPCI